MPAQETWVPCPTPKDITLFYTVSISDKEHGRYQTIRTDSIIDWKAIYERPLRLWKGGFEQVKITNAFLSMGK